jgi:cysteine synthase A
VIQVDAEAAREMARRCAREEGMLVGISSGATLAAIAQKLPELPAGARVLGFNYDTGERYLSIEGFLPASAARRRGCAAHRPVPAAAW